MFKKTSLGTIQKPDSNRTVALNFVNGGVTEQVAYTCPNGYIATVKSYLTRMGAFGAGTSLDFKAAGIALRRVTHPTDTNEPRAVELAGNGIRLAAGQTISYQGNSAANNSDGLILLTIQELPT